jgi:hypothetical protein
MILQVYAQYVLKISLFSVLTVSELKNLETHQTATLLTKIHFLSMFNAYIVKKDTFLLMESVLQKVQF